MTAETADTRTGEITPSPTPYQLLPRLSDDEYEALRADIAEHGIRVPIDVDENGTIIDGHHRAWIAADLGVECPRRVVAGLSDEAKRSHAIAVNIHRRNLSREQRRELIARLRGEGMSVRRIAEVTQASVGTVAGDLRCSEVNTSQVTGSDGKTYPATRPTATVTRRETTTETTTVDTETGEINPKPAPRKPRTDVVATVTDALTDIDNARRRLCDLTRTHLASQSDEARAAWAANLAEQLEALHGFLNALKES